MTKVREKPERDNATRLQVKKRSNPYRMIDVRAIEDTRLSNKAVGLLARLLVKPTDWEINMTHLAKTYPDGEKSLRSAMKELQQFGYAKLETIYDFQQKKAVGKRWVVTDWPEKEELRKLPKGLDKVEFSDKAETAKRSKSEKQKVCKAESLETATYRSSTSKGSSLQEENNFKETTHTQPAPAKSVCASENENENSNTDQGSPSSIGTFKGGLSDQQSTGKSSGRCSNIEKYCAENKIRLEDVTEHVATRFCGFIYNNRKDKIKYIPGGSREARREHLERFFDSMYKDREKKGNRNGYYVCPPATEGEAFETWFADTFTRYKVWNDFYQAHRTKKHANGKGPLPNGRLMSEEAVRRCYAELVAEGYR